MATGTGKTRTCIGLVYRLIKAGRFRRVLFLVDRTALGEQATNAFKNPRWQKLFPHLQEVGVEVVVDSDLATLRAAFHDHLRRIQDARRAGMVKPTPEQASVEKLFPTVARWVRDGHTEVGDQEGAGFVARALDHGGLAFEGDRPRTLAEALAALEKGLGEWFEEQGIEVEDS
jgi:hypothetical protein